MKGIHPNLAGAIQCALCAALMVVGGCRSTSSGVASNPFMAPDRVAPPSTRALAPGQAQPYYQGDPLPVMQSAAPPSPAESITSEAATAARSASGRPLAWNAPAAGNPGTTTAPPNVAQVAPPPTATLGANAIAKPTTPAGNEAAIAVPTDVADLRFTLPPPSAMEPNGPAPAAPISQAIAHSIVPPTQGAVPASYSAPSPAGLQPLVGEAQLNPTPKVESPWRTPQVGQNSTPPTYGMQAATAPTTLRPLMGPQQATPSPQPAVAPPPLPPTNVMAVQLRAVPSPPQPGDPNPRIRIPGYEVPQTAAADGFRARTSMR